MNPSEEEQEDIRLPDDTLEILREFLKEKNERELTEKNLEHSDSNSNITFEENWQLSQFWYNERTKTVLATICLKLIKEIVEPQSDGNEKPIQIGLLSCPSLYRSIKDIHPTGVRLFEYDTRFAAFGNDFIHYDYNSASDASYLQDFNGCFDIIIADPPFLSEECIEKLSILVNRMAKPTCKVILCSGKTVEEWARKYMGLEITTFEPEHERNLGNQFSSYANFNLNEYLK